MVLSTLRTTLNRRPILKSMATITSLLFGADIVCQIIENKGIGNFNFARLRNMATIGVVYYGPVYYYYYGWLDRRLPGKNPRTIMIKLFIDQVIYTIPSLFMFYIIIGTLERKSVPEIKNELRLKYIPTYITATIFWPAVQAFNFAIVPPMYRILYISGASFVWLIFLSYIKNRPKLPVMFEKIQNFASGIDNSPSSSGVVVIEDIKEK